MQCNIDRKGRLARLISGWLQLLAAAGLLLGASMGWLTGLWPWIVGGLLIPFGLLALYEARKGWCVMRAMGFKTPM